MYNLIVSGRHQEAALSVSFDPSARLSVCHTPFVFSKSESHSVHVIQTSHL